MSETRNEGRRARAGDHASNEERRARAGDHATAPPPGAPAPSRAEIRATIDRLLDARADDATICPSDVARALAPDPQWRDLMDAVRVVAAEEHGRGHVEIRQHGERADPATARGPIRIGRPRD